MTKSWRKKMLKGIEIQIIGTSQDVRLLKKILDFYYYANAHATKTEKECIKTYKDLIDYATERAKERKAD